MDPNLSSIGALDPNLRALKLFFQVSGSRRTDQGPTEQISARRNESGSRSKNQGSKGRIRARRTDHSPQNAKGPDRSGPHVADPSMWDGSGPCRSNQGRGTDQDPRDRPESHETDEPGPRKTNQGLQDEPGPCGTDQGPAEPTRALLDYQDPA